mgnify:CR=1 FL=1
MIHRTQSADEVFVTLDTFDDTRVIPLPNLTMQVIGYNGLYSYYGHRYHSPLYENLEINTNYHIMLSVVELWFKNVIDQQQSHTTPMLRSLRLQHCFLFLPFLLQHVHVTSGVTVVTVPHISSSSTHFPL